MATKIVTIPKNVPTATIKEAIQKYLKESDETEVIDKTLGKVLHHEDDARDEKGRVKRDTVTYKEVSPKSGKDKGVMNKIIATLSGSSSSAFRVALEDMLALQELEAKVKELKAKVERDGVKEKMHNFFGPAYEFVTRVVELANTYQLILTKQPIAKTNVKWSQAWEELQKHLTPELLAKGEEIVKMYSTIQAPEAPRLSVEPLEESAISDAWSKIKSWFSHFADSVKSWGKSFDTKLSHLNDMIKAL